MHIAMTRPLLLAGALMMAAFGASANGMLTDKDGMTLYVFDKDVGEKPACYDDCAAKWPPYLGNEGETLGEGWSLVPRNDATWQWAYDGKPVYFYAQDKAKGDAKGDGLGGVWHVIKE